MNSPKSHTRMPLPRPIKETMVNRNPHASIPYVRGVSSNQHSLVMIRKMAPRDGDVCALPADVDEAVAKIAEAAAVDPYVLRIRFDLNGVSVGSHAALECEVADDDVLALLQAQAFAGELDLVAAAVDGGVRGDAQIRGELDGA